MAENYYRKATEIFKRFDTNISHDWVIKNNLKEKANSIIRRMENAKSDEQFDKAAYDFKRTVVIPYFNDHVSTLDSKQIKGFIENNPIINMKPPSYLGSYDELKRNEVFVDVPYAKISVGNDGKKHVDVPLLRVINDPKILNAVAGRLNVAPEDLKEHVENEWNLKKQREWVEEEKSMRKAMVDGGEINGVKFQGRKGVLKEYDRNFWSGVLRTVAPELYAGMRRDIAEGKGEAGSIAGWLGEHKKDFAIDAMRNTALAATGFTASPIVTAGMVGATETAALAGSNYYDMSPRNLAGAWTGAMFAGTVPSMVARYAGPLVRSGSKTLKNIGRDVLRRIRNGEGTPAEAEQQRLFDLVDEAARIVGAKIAGNETLRSSDVNNAVDAVYQKIVSSPKVAFSGGTSIYKSDVEKALMTVDGVKQIKRLLEAPSKSTYSEWNKMSQNPNYGYEERAVLQDALDKADVMFPEAVKEIKYISGNGKLLNSVVAAGAKGVNFVGSKTEPMAARNVYAEGIDSYEKSNPEQVEYWKRYGIPDWDPLAEEFNEKYGEGR